MKARGLTGVKLIIPDACMGLYESVGDYYPDTDWQRCMVHFHHNVAKRVPSTKVKEMARILKEIYAQESREAAMNKVTDLCEKLREMKLHKASELIEQKIEDTLTYYSYPDNHWVHIRTNNALERITREIRRRTSVVDAFPDGNSALMFVAARLRYISGTKWGAKRYLSMEELYKQGITELQSA